MYKTLKYSITTRNQNSRVHTEPHSTLQFYTSGTCSGGGQFCSHNENKI